MIKLHGTVVIKCLMKSVPEQSVKNGGFRNAKCPLVTHILACSAKKKKSKPSFLMSRIENQPVGQKQNDYFRIFFKPFSENIFTYIE
jgi:hypothetical protein